MWLAPLGLPRGRYPVSWSGINLVKWGGIAFYSFPVMRLAPRSSLSLLLLLTLSNLSKLPTAFANLGRVGDAEDCDKVISVTALKESVQRVDLQTIFIRDTFAIEAVKGTPSCAIGLSTSDDDRVLAHGMKGFEWVGSQSQTTALRAEVFDVSDGLGEKDLCTKATEIKKFNGQYNFLGCFKDNYYREFDIHKIFETITIQKCDEWCHHHSISDFKYFALQGRRCSCANTYGTDTRHYYQTEIAECGEYPYLGNDKYFSYGLSREVDFRNAVYERKVENIVTPGEISELPSDLISGRLPIQKETLFVESPEEHPFLKVRNEHCSFEENSRDKDFDQCSAGLKKYGWTTGEIPKGRVLDAISKEHSAHATSISAYTNIESSPSMIEVRLDSALEVEEPFAKRRLWHSSFNPFTMHSARSQPTWALTESEKENMGDHCTNSRNEREISCPDECGPSYYYSSSHIGCYLNSQRAEIIKFTQEVPESKALGTCRKLCGDRGSDYMGITQLVNCHCGSPNSKRRISDGSCARETGHPTMRNRMSLHRISRKINSERFCSMVSGDRKRTFETACRVNSASFCKKLNGIHIYPHLHKDSERGDKCVNAKGNEPVREEYRCPTRCYYNGRECIKAGTTETLCEVSLFQTAAIDESTCKSKCATTDGCKGFTFSDDPNTLPIKGTYRDGETIMDDDCVGRVYYGFSSTRDIMQNMKRYNYLVQRRQEGDIFACSRNTMGGDPVRHMAKHCVCQPNVCLLHFQKDIEHAPKTGSNCGVLKPTHKPSSKNYAIKWSGFLRLRPGSAGDSVEFKAVSDQPAKVVIDGVVLFDSRQCANGGIYTPPVIATKVLELANDGRGLYPIEIILIKGHGKYPTFSLTYMHLNGRDTVVPIYNTIGAPIGKSTRSV